MDEAFKYRAQTQPLSQDSAAVRESSTRSGAYSLQLPEVSTANSPRSDCGDTETGDLGMRHDDERHPVHSPTFESQLSFHLPEVDAHVTADMTQQQANSSSGDVTMALTGSDQRHDAPASDSVARGLAPSSFAATKQPINRDFRLLLHRLDAFQPHDLFLGEYVLLGREQRRQGGARSACSCTHTPQGAMYCMLWQVLAMALLRSWHFSSAAVRVLLCFTPHRTRLAVRWGQRKPALRIGNCNIQCRTRGDT